ncbi:MAG: Ribosome-binding factor A [Parcubacteria group bacterium Gr01-1014_70]|nr:MAG: Ribosome-binding factor A [Parcubacteria group bacterium Gr01-1014_70]
MKHRDEKLSALIREEAALFLEANADIPLGILCTVTRVTLSSDRRYADVFISIFPTTRIGIFLNRFKTWQHEFNVHAKEMLKLKHIPAVRFKLDESGLKQERIEKLLKGEKK